MTDYRKIPLGLHDQKQDPRNYSLATIGIMPDENYPKVASPIIKHPIRDQGMTSMCFAFAMAKVIETQHYMETGEEIKVSEGFLYWLKTITNGEGMVPFFDLDIPKRIGAVTTDMFEAFGSWAEIDAKMKTQDVAALKALAVKLRAKTTLQLAAFEVPAYLHLWKAGIISVDVYDSYYDTGSDGIIPPISGPYLGGHGKYFDQTEYINGVLHVSGDNSWGPKWGDEGRFHIPIDHPCIKGFYGFVDVTPLTNTLTLTIGSKILETSKGNVELPQAPLLVNGSTMIPLRGVIEVLGKLVEWQPLTPAKPNQEGSKIVIKMPPSIEKLLII